MSLLQRISAGDEGAISACLDEYGDLVWRLARRYLNRADAEIEDAVQEVFIELWVSADRYDPARGGEPAFVATVAHRRLTDYQRRVTSRRRATNAYAEGSSLELKSFDGSAAKGAQAEKAVDALRELPEGEREALWLWLYRGLTHREIGEAVSSPIGTVKSRVRRGLLRIYNAVAGDESRVDPPVGRGSDSEGGAA